MIKKVLLIVLTILLLTTAGCRKKAAETIAPSTENETVETQEVTIPGMEDSIFDAMPQVDEEAAVPESSESVPVETALVETVPVELPKPGEMDFETFQNMKPSQQRAYQESFESLDAFYDWYTAAQEAYDKENAPIAVGDGVIDMSEILAKDN